MIKDIDKGWAAGFFEGEGCFYLHKDRNRLNGTARLRLYASLIQKGIYGKQLLERFQSIVNVGVVYNKPYLKTNCYTWKTTKSDEAQVVFELLKSQLGPRRIKTYLDCKSKVDNQIKHKRKRKSHCKKGHEYSVVGQRACGYCIICDREYKKVWYHKNKLTNTKIDVNIKEGKENGDV